MRIDEFGVEVHPVSLILSLDSLRWMFSEEGAVSLADVRLRYGDVAIERMRQAMDAGLDFLISV